LTRSRRQQLYSGFPAPRSAVAGRSHGQTRARDARCVATPWTLESRSVPGAAEALYQPIQWQRDANRASNIETNRTQFYHDATVDEHNPLDAMRLRVIEPHHITNP
jgi:hypothetical protein